MRSSGRTCSGIQSWNTAASNASVGHMVPSGDMKAARLPHFTHFIPQHSCSSTDGLSLHRHPAAKTLSSTRTTSHRRSRRKLTPDDHPRNNLTRTGAHPHRGTPAYEGRDGQPAFGQPDTNHERNRPRQCRHPVESQNWVVDAMNGSHAPRKVGDMGIDGFSFPTPDPIQVKQSDRVGRPVIGPLCHGGELQ